LLKLGFTMANTPTESPVNLEAMIVEAAYYKAEKRKSYIYLFIRYKYPFISF
jgi:hypothetical protein